ncbi:SpaH/EbpB family LPXTG-anchored major pilin [Leucobacter sp. UCMA 4100]|uniref:SpaH/EbpB family LPXTG-anchored major pilin n=1 Tax=Leucobacter sp. UCMA 4100 TaxID=2810534 RepID=UPI0022EAB1FA|nr:SpaH/EbpB family LPXTG-anchored major pilin [Leucobacter sp. UCMA 4100]MDA3146244.1 SpaH/EbpB family LPXTG-anchored major pilin [Leucobacter sp. UCMA 4100]
MNTHTKPRAVRRGIAATAVMAVGALGLFVGASTAHAEEIDTTRTGSITINKFEAPGEGQMNPDGNGTRPDSKPIDDVVFEYCKIDGIDLLSGANIGWDTLRGLTADDLVGARTGTALGNLTLTGCTVMDPTVNGVTETGSIALGAYLIREKTVPAHVTKKSEPFVVTVPTPGVNVGEGDGTWVYNVNVYPKNDVGDTPVKTIQNQPTNGYVLGSKINYTISQKAPAVTGDTYTKFIVTDTLDERLTGSELPLVTLNGAPLTLGDDYTAVWTKGGTPERSTLTVELSGTALADLTVGDVLKVDFMATLTTLGDGNMPNKAIVNVNDLDLDGDNNPGTPTNEVWTRWGGVSMKKVDVETTGKGLQGAQFTLYISEKASGCKLDEGLEQVKNADGSEFIVESGSDGSILIDGLWIGDDELNGGQMTNGLSARCYVLIETRAPNGFVLPTGDAAKTEVIVNPGEVTEISKEITNKQQRVPELPLTGSAGQVLMIVAGLALVAVAAGTVVFNRRKRA